MRFLSFVLCVGVCLGVECFEDKDLYFKVESHCTDLACDFQLILLDKTKPDRFVVLDSTSDIQDISFMHNGVTYTYNQKFLSAKEQNPREIESVPCFYIDGHIHTDSWQDLSAYSFAKEWVNAADTIDGDYFTISQENEKLSFELSEVRLANNAQIKTSQHFLLKPLSKTQAYVVAMTQKSCGVLVEKKDDFTLKVGSFANKKTCDFLKRADGGYLVYDVYLRFQPSFQCPKNLEQEQRDAQILCASKELSTKERQIMLLLKDQNQEFVQKRKSCQDEACLRELFEMQYKRGF